MTTAPFTLPATGPFANEGSASTAHPLDDNFLTLLDQLRTRRKIQTLRQPSGPREAIFWLTHPGRVLAPNRFSTVREARAFVANLYHLGAPKVHVAHCHGDQADALIVELPADPAQRGQLVTLFSREFDTPFSEKPWLNTLTFAWI